MERIIKIIGLLCLYLCVSHPALAAYDLSAPSENATIGKKKAWASINATQMQVGGTAVTATAAELNIMDGVTATYSEINAAADKSAAAVVSATDATLALTQALHANRVVVANRAAGVAFTLPEATGTGDAYTIVIGTAMTSGSLTITTADTTNADLTGYVIAVDLDAATTAVMYQTVQGTGDDIITMNRTTQGGVNIGTDRYTITDIATDVWAVEGHFLVPTGSNPATPFSGT